VIEAVGGAWSGAEAAAAGAASGAQSLAGRESERGGSAARRARSQRLGRRPASSQSAGSSALDHCSAPRRTCPTPATPLHTQGRCVRRLQALPVVILAKIGQHKADLFMNRKHLYRPVYEFISNYHACQMNSGVL
jgi:hypothetical protein